MGRIDERTRSAGLVMGRLVFWPAGVCLLLGGLGYWPTLRLAGPSAIPSMYAGIGVVLASVSAGSVILLRDLGSVGGAERFKLALRAGLIRLIATVLVSLLLVLLDFTWLEVETFMIWVGIAYIVAVKAETFAVLSVFKRVGKQQG